MAGAGRNVFPEPAYQVPPGSPSAQPGMDVFSPPTSSTMNGVGPVIGEMTRFGSPDNAISICVDNGSASWYPLFYGQTNNNDGWRLGDASQNRLLRISPDTKMASWAIPANIPDNAAILVVPITPNGAGVSWMLNLPQPDFLCSEDTGYNACFPSGTAGFTSTVRVMGKTLCKPITCQSVNTIGTGTLTFTVPKGLNFTAGDVISIIAKSVSLQVAGGANYMKGTITSYSGVKLVVNITKSVGSGTYLYWKIYDAGYTNIWLSVSGQQAFISTANITDVLPWCVKFTLPATVGSHTLTAGDTVQVWVHNSMGGNLRGWVQCPMTITVATPASISMNYTDVSGTGSQGSPLAASGDTTGNSDWTNLSTIINAQTVPSRVWLASGTFYFKQQVFLGGHLGVAISLKGQGVGVTIIHPGSTANYGSTGMFSSASGVLSEVNSLTIDTQSNTTFSLFTTTGIAAVARVVSCTLKALNSRCQCVTGGGFGLIFHSYVVNSTLTGEYGIYDGGGNGCTLYCDNCQSFICDGDVDGASAMHAYIFNTANIVVTNCISQNYNVSGALSQRGNGKFVDVTQDTTNNYIAENTTIQLSPQSGDSFLGTGEQVAYEPQLDGSFSANIVSTAIVGGVTTITFANYTGFTKVHAFVTGGKGKYQTANVTNVSGNTLTLNKLLPITLDTTSVVEVITANSECTVVLNTLQGFNVPGSSSMGWTLFGSACNNVFQHNSVSATAFTFSENFWNISGSINAVGGWNLYADNQFSSIEGEQQITFANCGWGNIDRNNITTCTTDYLFLHVGRQYPSNEGNIYDNCYFSGAPNAGQASNLQAAPATFLLWNTQMWGNNTGPAWNGANAANYNVNPLGTSKLTQFTSGNQP